MREQIILDIKDEDYYNKLLSDLIELFEEYDFPCWEKDEKIHRIKITDVFTRIDIQHLFLHIEIIISKENSLIIPIKLNQISLFTYERIQGIKGR